MDNQQPGRNDPCSCGSGKKYKKCCLEKLEAIDFKWHRLRQLEGTVVDRHLGPYLRTLPECVIGNALEDCLWEELPEIISREALFDCFLMPWFLFSWIPLEDLGLEGYQSNKTVARNYLEANREKLTPEEQNFIEAMDKTFYSFYTVLEVEKNKSLLVKDMLLGEPHLVKERQGTQLLNRGDIIFSRILTLDEQSTFVGMAPFVLWSQHHSLLLEFKKWLIKENDDKPLSAEALGREFNWDILDYFFEALKQMFENPLPTLVNTDGEAIQFSVSHFKLTLSPEETVKRLLPMALSEDAEEFLKDAKREKSGKVTEIEMLWIKESNKKNREGEHTVHGTLTIKEGKLTLETNSVERTEEGKKTLKELLGESIFFQKTLIESLEHKMELLRGNPKEADQKWAETPEVEAQIRAMAKAHWESWFDEPVPALGNKTPREAAQTVEGREQLEALLLEYEVRDRVKIRDDPFRTDIGFIKATLSL